MTKGVKVTKRTDCLSCERATEDAKNHHEAKDDREMQLDSTYPDNWSTDLDLLHSNEYVVRAQVVVIAAADSPRLAHH